MPRQARNPCSGFGLVRMMISTRAAVPGRGAGPEQVATKDLLRQCSELRGYVRNHRRGIVSYHRRYHSDRPVSTSRAEGCVDEIANARMSKRQRMRWSARGAHRVAVVRAAVLDRRLGATSGNQMAA